MKILVTGGAGFIGSHSADALIRMGHTVRIFDNLSTGLRTNVNRDAELVIGDVRDFEAVHHATRGVDAVLHLAGLTGAPQSLAHPLDTYNINAHGAVHVFEAARREGLRRVVLASTAAVYGDVPGRKTEQSAIRPLVPYACSKLMAEQAAVNYSRSYGMEIVRMRYFNAYGPRQRADSAYGGVTALFASAIKHNQQCVVFGDGTNTRDYVFIRDLAMANARALLYEMPAVWQMDPEEPRSPVYNIGLGASASVNDILDAFERVLKRSVPRTHRPARAGEILHSSTDISRAKAELDWHPDTPLEQGLKELLGA